VTIGTRREGGSARRDVAAFTPRRATAAPVSS
jgi:hypothetical protein